METRQILDSNNNVIGELTLPSETPEDVWTEKLSHYSTAPASEPVVNRVTGYIKDARAFALNLADKFAAENSLLGIKQAGKTGDVMDYLHEMVHCVLSGSMNEAVTVLDTFILDTSDRKAALAPFITNDRLTAYKNAVQDYLGVPRT